MIRTLALIIALTCITACAQFPQLDAAAPKNLGQRPDLLLTDQLPAASKDTKIQNDNAAADALRDRADALRDR